MGKKATKSVSKGFKKATKSVSKGFKKAAKGITKVVKDIGSATGKLLEKGLGAIGGVVAKVPGLKSLGKEIARWGEDLNQVIKVLNGEYHDDVKKIEAYKKRVEEYGNRLNAKVTQYNLGLDELLDRLEGLVAFDEIFHMAYSNRIGDYQEFNSPELEIMTKQYELMMRELKRLIADLKSEYDFVIGLTEGAFVQRIIGSLIMIVGGLNSDLRNIASGNFDSKIFTRILMIVIAVVMIVLSIFTGGSTLFIALAIILLFLNLDGMYANGAATGAIMSSLDFIFNDLLNLDDLIGSDFEKFDKDHEDYQEMVGYVKLSLTIATIIAAWGSGGVCSGAESSSGINAGTAGTYGTNMGSQQTSMLAAQDAGFTTNTVSYGGGAITIGDSLQTSAFLGAKFPTYASLYEAYNIASGIKDVISQNKLYKEMEERLKSDLNKVDEAIVSKTNKNMMKHYKDAAYFLQDQQEYIDRYVWGMTSQSMYVDPYGTTPVANIRFTPDKDTRMMSFGFEDVFDESTQAGSKGYFNNILYG